MIFNLFDIATLSTFHHMLLNMFSDQNVQQKNHGTPKKRDFIEQKPQASLEILRIHHEGLALW